MPAHSPRCPRLRRVLQNKRLGFTLVEILVVLCIVGILAAILVPVFASARDKARTASCAANLRQIGLALQLYTSDNGGFYPPARSPANNCSWVDRVFRYVKSPEVLWCPTFEEGEYRPGCGPSEEVGGVLLKFDGSYSLNTLEDAWGAGSAQAIVSERRVRLPSSTILILDGNGTGFVNPGQYATMTTLEDLKSRNIPDRHNGGANVLFADWHVKWMKMPDLFPRRQWRATGTE